MYRKLEFDIWQDDKFRELSAPGPSAQGLFLNLIVGRHTCVLPGVIIARPGEIFAALSWPANYNSASEEYWEQCGVAVGFGKSSREGFREGSREGFREGFAQGCYTGEEALAQLVEMSMVVVDDFAGVIYLPNGIRHNKPASPNHVRGYGDTWRRVPRCDLKQKIYEDWRGFMKTLGKPFLETFLEVLQEPYGKPLAKPSRKPVSSKQKAVNRKQRGKKNSRGRPAVAATPTRPPAAFDFTEVYSHYPRKAGKKAGMDKLKKLVQSQEDFELFRDAVIKMGKSWKGHPTKYCPYFSTFVNQEMWKDEDLPVPGECVESRNAGQGLSAEEILQSALELEAQGR